MAGLTSTPPAIVVLGPSALPTARRLQAALPGAAIHALQGRATGDVAYSELASHLRELYSTGTPIVALCAAGIVIRCIAPMLANKGVEPPVLAVAEDGSAVVPLLGGLAGVNVLAREIARALDVAPAITTSGELRFGTCLLNPPSGYTLASLDEGKRFVSDLLAGASVRIDGDAPWLDAAQLRKDDSASHAVRVTPRIVESGGSDLVIHPHAVVAAIDGPAETAAERVREAMEANGLAPVSLAALLAPIDRIGETALEQAAIEFDVPLRFIDTGPGRIGMAQDRCANNDEAGTGIASAERALQLLHNALRIQHEQLTHTNGIALAVGAEPIDVGSLGQARGRVDVIGLGPGCAELMAPAARAALAEATDILGYETYLRMAGPFGTHQRVHGSDNREELQRARHAFELASAGRRVAIVSSGDPGVFAMAAAVMEALDGADEPRWATVEIRIVPGISAAMATAAQAGAPLGHDFCVLSLSDNLKPWRVIENRLRHAVEADLVIAMYNPISRARPWQLDKALEIVRSCRRPDTRVVLGRDIGRPGAALVTTTLGELRSEQVDMRTTVIVGSTMTRAVPRSDGGEWIYTPRWYED